MLGIQNRLSLQLRATRHAPVAATSADARQHQRRSRCHATPPPSPALASRSSDAAPDQEKHAAAEPSTSGSGGGGEGIRRRVLLQGSLAPLLVPMVVGSDDATTIINSVLSGYGLPTLKASAGYKVWDEFADEYTFEYPKAWVSRPNSLRKGVYISDFQTADKIAVEVLGIPEDGDLATAAVTAAVLPGGGRLTQDDLLTLPPRSDVKVTSLTLDRQDYIYLEFPSETITRSGYQIRRRNFAAAAVKRGKLYTIAASARGDQYNEAKRQLLQHVVESFRVR